MKKMWQSFACLALVLLLVGCSNYKFKPTTNYEIDDFSHTNQRGEEIALDDLKGKPWLAMFMFSSCTTVCPPMTDNMRFLQERLEEEGVTEYNIVGFSVDPTVDTPDVLADYLYLFDVQDESKWHLLTGYDQTYIEQFALNNFRAVVQKIDGNDQVIHNTVFYLVDEKGVAVKNYAGYSATSSKIPIDTIVEDMKALIEERL